MDERSMTPQEVADKLRIAKNTVYEMIKRGELKSYKVGRKIRIDISAVEALKGNFQKSANQISHSLSTQTPLPEAIKDGVVICGQDGILDILSRHLEQQPSGFRAYRSHLASYNGLYALYNRKADIATAHLWDGDSGLYNIDYVKKMIPGIPVRMIRLAKRQQGFYVSKGNPLNINNWEDLKRKNPVLINREKGSGVRVLIDEHLRLMGIPGNSIRGYENETASHLEVASAVARGAADVAVGNEKTTLQVSDIDFIPIQEEYYDMVMLQENADKPAFRTVIEIIQSQQFKEEVQGLGGYDVSEMGKILL